MVGGQGKKENGDGDDVDFASVRALARIATEFNLEEIEVNGGGAPAGASGRVPRGRRGRVGCFSSAPASSPRPIALTPPVEAKGEAGTFVTSPFVGTFYRAPAPEAPPFVDLGQAVRKGQVVCIVEAMKLMNEIESEFDGKILEILVKNAEHVEYGQPLFRIEKA